VGRCLSQLGCILRRHGQTAYLCCRCIAPPHCRNGTGARHENHTKHRMKQEGDQSQQQDESQGHAHWATDMLSHSSLFVELAWRIVYLSSCRLSASFLLCCKLPTVFCQFVSRKTFGTLVAHFFASKCFLLCSLNLCLGKRLGHLWHISSHQSASVNLCLGKRLGHLWHISSHQSASYCVLSICVLENVWDTCGTFLRIKARP
jgi:hypothetical protein